MAEKLKNNVNNGTENQQQGENPQPETKESKAKEITFKVPKWLIFLGNILEGILALFGALVGALLIKDAITPKRTFTPTATAAEPETKTVYQDSDVTVTEF